MCDELSSAAGVVSGELSSASRFLHDAAKGDEDAFAAIVEAYNEDMLRVAFAICGDGWLAQDAAQDAWHKAWRKLSSLKDAGSLRAWLLAVVANEARQVRRRQRRKRFFELRPNSGGDDDLMLNIPARIDDTQQREHHADLSAALSTLNDRDRMLVALRYVAGLQAPEIATAIGLSPSGVRSRLARALVKLRKELDYG